MEKNSLKNIVVLKNVPSNIIDEAFVILKSNKMAKKLEYIDKATNHRDTNNKDKKNYIIKEAESVIANYMEKIEGKDKSITKVNYNKNYKKLKIYSIIMSILFFITLLAKL